MRNKMASILGTRTIKIRSGTENGVKGVSVNFSDFQSRLIRVPELEPFKMSHP